MTGLVCGERRCGVRCPVCGMSVWDRRKNRMAGCGNPAGRSDGGPGRDGTAARAGCEAGGVNCAACSNRENSGRFRLCGGVVAPDGTGRSFRKDFPDRSGRHDEENARKTAEGTVPGDFPAGPFGRVWGGDYSTVSETRKSSPEAGSVTTMLRSSLVKWK